MSSIYSNALFCAFFTPLYQHNSIRKISILSGFQWTRAVCILRWNWEKLLIRCCNVPDICVVWHSGKLGSYEACPYGFTISKLHYSYGIFLLVLLMSLRFYLRQFDWSMLYRSNLLIFHIRRFFWTTRIERILKCEIDNESNWTILYLGSHWQEIVFCSILLSILTASLLMKNVLPLKGLNFPMCVLSICNHIFLLPCNGNRLTIGI